MADARWGKVRFIVKDFPREDRGKITVGFSLSVEPAGDTDALDGDGLALELVPGTTAEEAQALARQLDGVVLGVSFTRFFPSDSELPDPSKKLS